MSQPVGQPGDAAALLATAAAAAKCSPCGCAHGAVATIEGASDLPDQLATASAALHAHLTAERYECLGCNVCWPAEAVTRLTEGGLLEASAACPTDAVVRRDGWPPLPGSFRVLRWRAPVAVCTLGDIELAEVVAASAGPETSIVGTLATENLGIERLVLNTVTNPNIRFLLVAGTEPRQTVGHLPGGSLLALAHNGIDPKRRIIGAPGRRPLLVNIDSESIATFRSAVTVVDLVGETDPEAILAAARHAADRNPGPAEPAQPLDRISPTAGHLPKHMTADPAGYFVVYPDRARKMLTVEHYTNDGVLDSVIEGPSPAHVYTAVIDKELLTRLDHAAYLGRELARAEAALDGAPYTQDAAPEATNCHAACTSPRRATGAD